jgi:nicotinamide-nucleotide amidase
VPEPEVIASEVLETLADREASLAVAESASGGALTRALVANPGASDVLDRGLVTYSYRSKRALLGVSREALDAHGAVSRPVAEAMAGGVRDTADTTWGLATTGVAGPSGGTEETPVGTAFVGVAHAAPWGSGESFTRVTRIHVDGDRTEVMAGIAGRALVNLQDALTEVDH